MEEQQFQECLKRWNDNNGEPFWQELGDKYGLSKRTIRYQFNKERKIRGITEKNQQLSKMKESHSKNSDGTHTSDRLIEIHEQDLNDEVALLRAHNYSPEKWSLVSSNSSMWHSLKKGKDGRLVQLSSKIRVKPITLQDISPEAIVEYYNNNLKVNKKVFKEFVPSEDERVLEICLADMHLGARHYKENSSDLEEIFDRVMKDIFYRIKNDKQGFTKILLVPLGDIFHFDNRKQQTTRHQQVVDGNGMNPLEMFDKATEMFIGIIDELLSYAPVEILFIPGNHDGLSLYHLIASLSAYYRNVHNFSADLSHENRKWRLVGENLIGLSHGEMPKKNRIHWLAVEASREWGKSKYREVHDGHLHHEEVIENGGVKTRRLPALAITDYWHYEMGYTGAIRSTMSFVWDSSRLGWTDMWQSTG